MQEGIFREVYKSTKRVVRNSEYALLHPSNLPPPLPLQLLREHLPHRFRAHAPHAPQPRRHEREQPLELAAHVAQLVACGFVRRGRGLDVGVVVVS